MGTGNSRRSKGRRLFALLLPFCAAALTSFGARETGGKKAEAPAEGGFYRDQVRERLGLDAEDHAGGDTGINGQETIRVTGRVRLVGSAPFSRLVVSGEAGEWYVEGGDSGRLQPLQHQTVTVEGRLFAEDIIMVNGDRLGRRYILRDLKLIKTGE